MCQEGKAKSCRLKKILEFLGKNSPNPLDKPHKVWYNEYVKRTGSKRIWGTSKIMCQTPLAVENFLKKV
jgi:hypothetical protein